MQELDFEVPVDLFAESGLPDLFRQAQIMYLLKLDSEGFLLICKIQLSEWVLVKKEVKKGYIGKKALVKRIGKDKSGNVLLQVEGKWLVQNPKEHQFFKAMEDSPSMFGLGNPVITPSGIKFSVIGEATRIRDLLSGLEEFNVPHRVRRLSRLEARNESLLSGLTSQQNRILRLAHIMGYYEIPRRTRTEDLARILEMDKATVGEHLRRAEKNAFDQLFAE